MIGGIPQSTLAILLQSFIRDSNVQSFVNFNSVALGIKWMYEIKTQQTLQEMKELAQFMVERMTDSVTSIEDDILTIRDVVESLRESTNIIAASTKKLEAKGKILDIKRITQLPPISPELPTQSAYKCVRLRGYMVSPYHLIVRTDNKLDVDKTHFYNSSMSM